MTRFFLFLLSSLLSVTVLVACGSEATPTPTAVSPTATATSAAPQETNTPEPTPTPSPTPLPPALDVSDQILGPEGIITLTAVRTPEDGVVALYLASARELGTADLLGYTAVQAGETDDVTIEITEQPLSDVTDTLQVALHTPAAVADFDPTVADLLLITEFEIENQAIEPEIVLTQETVDEDGLFIVERVVAPEAGWLAIYNDMAGEPDALLGYAPITAGENNAVPIYLRWREANNDLLAILYRDDGAEAGRFETGDTAVMFANEPATQTHTITLPAQITPLDQPVVNGQLIVPRVVSNGPGFVVVYQSENNQAGFIIGTQYVPDGVSESVAVSVTQAAVTPQLLLTLHADGNDNQTFDFPGPDEPQTAGGQQFFVPQNSDVGTYLVTADQPLSAENQVVVPLVAAEESVWVVVYAPDDAAEAGLGAILGQTRVPAGVSENIVVALEEAPTAETLVAVLHQSVDPQESFDPETDSPLRRRLAPLAATFNLLDSHTE